MASVYQKKGRASWYIWYRDAFGKEHDRPITAKTKAEANRFKAEMERSIERQLMGLDPLPVTSSITLGELCSWWLKECCGRRALKREGSRLEEHVIGQDLGAVPLHRLDSGHLEAKFQAMEKAEQSAGSINRLRSTLGSVFDKADLLKKWTRSNPVAKTRPRAVPKRAYLTLQPEEIALVLRVLSPWWRDLFATGFYMGLRKGELFALRKADVNLVDRELVVQRSHDSDTVKGKVAAVLPIPGPLVPYLERALKTKGELLFPDAAGGQRLPTSKPEVVLRRALARAGLITGYRHICRRCAALKKPHIEVHPDAEQRRCPVERGSSFEDGKQEGVCGMRLWASPIARPMRFHELRHSTATLLLRMGAPMAVVQRILRHANIKLTVDLYGHLDISDMRQAMDLMPDAEQAAQDVEARKAANFPDRPLPGSGGERNEAPDPLEEFSKSEALEWSGTPGSNRRPSPWQGTPRPAHLTVVEGKGAQLLETTDDAARLPEHPEASESTQRPDRPLTENR